MAACLTQICTSPEDAAYGAEYGNSWCDRAGVSVDIKLPESYTEQHAYFE